MDTRPTANLCHIAKVFDKIITVQLVNYLGKNNFLVPKQFGFRFGHSTQTALLYLTDCIREGIEDGLVTILMLFDFRKTFDTVKHESILVALKAIGFTGNALRFIHSYVTVWSYFFLGFDKHSAKGSEML